MAYEPPSIVPAGLTLPLYQEILDDMVASFLGIYGQTVYMGADSFDYQLLSIFALKAADIMSAFQLTYSSRSPAQAIGAALDTLVKLNGIARKASSFSTCVVTLTGTPGAIIKNGVVIDINGVRWDLPAEVTIGGGGSVSVTATCETLGNVNAQAGQLTIVGTPQAGWNSVTNTNAASPGQPVEPDSSLRARQALSVALPSITMLAGTIAAIAATAGVTRWNVLENPTGAVDANGNPPHSISAVVEGGADADVAAAIYNNRGIGCYTNGTTVVNVVDPNNGDIAMPISFFRPAGISIFAVLNIHPLLGWSTAVATAVQNAIADYINSLQIGELVTQSGLYAAAMSVTDLKNPTFSIRALKLGTAANPTGTNDIAMTFNQVAVSIASQVSIVLV